MFSPPGSDNADSKIKQRLVGAAVLIALAVIIVPMILDFRKDYDHVIKGTNIPPKPDDFHVEVCAFTIGNLTSRWVTDNVHVWIIDRFQ